MAYSSQNQTDFHQKNGTSERESDWKSCSCQKRHAVKEFSKYGSRPYQNKDGQTVLEGRTYRIVASPGFKGNAPKSEITISTGRSSRNKGCINPTQCKRMQSPYSERNTPAMTERDRHLLEQTIKGVCDGVAVLNTFDDVDQLMEISNLTQIQTSLSTVINEKRHQLEKSKLKRESEFFEWKADFYKRVTEQVKSESHDLEKRHRPLLEALSNLKAPSSSSSSSREKLENMHPDRDFEPRAESTRIDDGNDESLQIKVIGPKSRRRKPGNFTGID